MTQETLEEAANEYSKKKYSIDYGYCEEDYYISFLSFIEGAKYQQERSYSEEDLECAWNSSNQNMRFQFSSSAYKGITFKQWLEKFKQEISDGR